MPCSASRRNAIPAQNAAIAAEDFHSLTELNITTIINALALLCDFPRAQAD